jgi:hypothetical protein
MDFGDGGMSIVRLHIPFEERKAELSGAFLETEASQAPVTSSSCAAHAKGRCTSRRIAQADSADR